MVHARNRHEPDANGGARYMQADRRSALSHALAARFSNATAH